MKKTKKRLASILLTLVMAITLFFAAPMSVYAAAPDWTIGPGGDYATLDALIVADVLADGDTITLLGNVTGVEPFDIYNINITLYLNNFTLTIDVPSTTNNGAIYVGDDTLGGSLDVVGPGTLNASTAHASSAGISVYYSTLSMSNGAIINTTGPAGGTYANTSGIATVSTSTGSVIGVQAGEGGVVHVTGNVVATGATGAGAVAWIYSTTDGGQITIDGTITVPASGTYIQVGDAADIKNKSLLDFTLPTTKAGYLTYTDGQNNVWVGTTPIPVIKHFGTFTGSGTATGEINYPFYSGTSDFTELKLNGATVAASNYTVTEGSHVITLTQAYLSTFLNGNYTFRAFFNTGAYADLNLVVANPNAPGAGAGAGGGANGVPQTSDVNTTLGWTVVLALVILGVFGLLAWRRRHRAQE